MSMSIFDAFGPLDDLVQVIYQGPYRFVLLSRVDFDAIVPCWHVYVGLADKGRWWKGKWEEKDVHEFVVRGVSHSSSGQEFVNMMLMFDFIVDLGQKRILRST